MNDDEKQRRIEDLEKANARLEYLMAELESRQPDTEALHEAAMLQSHLEDCQAELAEAKAVIGKVSFTVNEILDGRPVDPGLTLEPWGSTLRRLEALVARIAAVANLSDETVARAAQLTSQAFARAGLEEVTFSFERAGMNKGWDKASVHLPPDEKAALAAWLVRMNIEKPPGVPVQVEFGPPPTRD